LAEREGAPPECGRDASLDGRRLLQVRFPRSASLRVSPGG